MRKTRKINKKNTLFHFYDDQIWNFEGILFSKDETRIDHMMCSDNIICHKINNRNNIKYTLQEITTLLDRYISKISNPGMKKYIKFEHMTHYNASADDKKIPYYHPDRGMTFDDIYPLCDPTLQNIIVGFDMDDTLHQVGGIFNILNKHFIKDLSKLTNSHITYNDIGEMYFGGKDRLAQFKMMFQNLSKTIGMENVYIITANTAHLLLEIIPDLYSKIFNIKFSKKNVKIATYGQLPKYKIIKNILDEAEGQSDLS